jgi:hypothetical protein
VVEEKRCYDLYFGDTDHDCGHCSFKLNHRLLYVPYASQCHEYRAGSRQVGCRIPCDECLYYVEREKRERGTGRASA